MIKHTKTMTKEEISELVERAKFEIERNVMMGALEPESDYFKAYALGICDMLFIQEELDGATLTALAGHLLEAIDEFFEEDTENE